MGGWPDTQWTAIETLPEHGGDEAQDPRLSSDVYVLCHGTVTCHSHTQNKPAVCILGLLPKKLCESWLDPLDRLKSKTQLGRGSSSRENM